VYEKTSQFPVKDLIYISGEYGSDVIGISNSRATRFLYSNSEIRAHVFDLDGENVRDFIIPYDRISNHLNFTGLLTWLGIAICGENVILQLTYDVGKEIQRNTNTEASNTSVSLLHWYKIQDLGLVIRLKYVKSLDEVHGYSRFFNKFPRIDDPQCDTEDNLYTFSFQPFTIFIRYRNKLYEKTNMAIFKNLWLPNVGYEAILLSDEYVAIVANLFQNVFRKWQSTSGQILYFLDVYKINCTVHGKINETYKKSNCKIDLLISFQKEFINKYAIFLTADKDLVGWPKWNIFRGQNRPLTAKIFNQ
jgi:hypothetical protein